MECWRRVLKFVIKALLLYAVTYVLHKLDYKIMIEIAEWIPLIFAVFINFSEMKKAVRKLCRRFRRVSLCFYIFYGRLIAITCVHIFICNLAYVINYQFITVPQNSEPILPGPGG